MVKAYFCLDPASRSALMRCALSKSDIVGFHSATKVELKLSKSHSHNWVKLTIGGMSDRRWRLQNYIAAYAEACGQKEQASKLITAMPAALIESDCGLIKQGRWS
ncbi:hypothetical protein J2X73_004548 [Novosphingobium sp. 1748]|uniref:DUF2274 domain-containing protein n=1 Tax=Novosphingobium sp. 1748 TaxID=2817760 RepID=UPI00285FDD25|nr:DUF2274 domain-containing protein [Novosphingobium sp. 1748]MDR6710143.1 hypothetical protein [Novosphingobium sp. 1748]